MAATELRSGRDYNNDDGDDDGGSHPQYLTPSELGTKEYWETFYNRSLEHISSKKEKKSTEHGRRDHVSDDGDDDDPGTSWFSEHNAPEKVLRFLTSRKFPLAPRRQNQQQQQQQQPSILDLGTGNGSMLALLRIRGGFGGYMVGVDYSPQSVQLARELQRLKLHSAYESGSDDGGDDGDDGEEDQDEEGDDWGADGDGDVNFDAPSSPEADPEKGEHEDVVGAVDNGVVGEGVPIRSNEKSKEEDGAIRFEEWDILDPENHLALTAAGERNGKMIPWFPYSTGGFDIVLDKGTFDAVSLSEDVIEGDDKKGEKAIQRRICERYPGIATKLVRKGGFLVVTSCNWTEEELIRWFTTGGDGRPDDGLAVWDIVEYPRFRFGGKEGQGVCTVCFRRKGR